MLSGSRLLVRSVCSVSWITSAFTTQSALYKDKVALNESDLEEQFICGWGPGGQKINKTQNCVFLKHLPTGLIVKCQDGRDLNKNRQFARERLRRRLDELMNGDESELAIERRDNHLKENQKTARAKRRLTMKIAFKASSTTDKEN